MPGRPAAAQPWAREAETWRSERSSGPRPRGTPAADVGDIIADVMEKVGKDGVIAVEEGKGLRLEAEFVEGMQIDRGYISPYFVTNPERMEAVIDDPYILITDKRLSAVNDLLPVLERALQVTKNLVIICDDCEGEAVATR